MENRGTVVVVGAGAMGHGIAQVAAMSGFQTVLVDLSAEILEGAVSKIRKSLERFVRAGKLEEGGMQAALERIQPTQDLAEGCREASLVIESVSEDLELKCRVFAEMDAAAPPEALLVTNTSQLSVTAMAAATSRPGQVAGMHWFNPPPLMQLVEVIQAVQSADETLEKVADYAKRMGKTVVRVKDRQGFVVSRAFSAHLLECFRMAEEGIASMEDIDTAIKLGLGYPMGPFELADLVGLDVIYHASKGMVEAHGDRFRPPQNLVRLYQAGHYGMKTGRGFYEYPRKERK